MDYIIYCINLISNTRFQQIAYDINTPKYKVKESELYNRACNNHRLLSYYVDYNRILELTKLQEYTILKFSLQLHLPLNDIALNCLSSIINSNKILLNYRTISLNDCVIYDVFYSNLTQFAAFHTDIEYEKFTGNAFNVWYLIKNNNKRGNMFLVNTPEYKREFTPCFLKDDVSNNLVEVIKHSYLNSLTGFNEKITNFDVRKMKMTYLNMHNGECLVMSKHQLHRTDLDRDKSFKGINFRVLVKNADGSLDCSKYDISIKPWHRYCKETGKLYNCNLTDFIS